MGPGGKTVPAILAAFWLSACGPQVTEVWLQIQEDASLPCLGASHLRLRINIPGHQPNPLLFDYFGVYFDEVSFLCHLVGELRCSDLPPGRGLGVQVQLSDSSTAEEGVLAEATSSAFDVSGSSPVQQVNISLYRQAGVERGTLLVDKPLDWGVVAGINILYFRVLRDADSSVAREYYISFDPVSRPDPFPLVISNLPTPAEMELYQFYLEGYAASQLLRTWSAPVYLGGDYTLFRFTPRP